MGRHDVNLGLWRERGGKTVAYAVTFFLLLVLIEWPVGGHSPFDHLPSTSPDQNETMDTDPPAAPTLASAVLAGSSNENVLISWSLSVDDGAGDDDVSHYAIYCHDGYDYEGDGYSYLGQVSGGTSSYVHFMAGDGDPFNHFYFVAANDTSGNSNWSGQAAKFLTPLKTGKQIASIPLVQEDTTLEVVLQTLEGSYKHVRYYKSSDQSHHWKSYWTFKTYRTLFDIDHTMGFWIDIVKPDDMVVMGLVPDVTQIELRHGWNFLSYPSFIERTLGEALSNMDWAQAQGYDDNPPFNLKQLSGSDVMTAGEGYWVWVDFPQVWQVSNAPGLPPHIVWTDPADGQTNIPLGECILISFSEPMDPSSVSLSVIPTTPIVVTWLNSTVLQICPLDAWNDCTAYTVQVVAGQSMGGKPLVPGPVPNPWTFSTNCCICYIVNTDPCDGAVGIPLNKPITIVFSEEMNPTTLDYSSNPDPGGWGVNWSTDNTVLLLTHNDFMSGTTYVFHVAYIEDIGGSPLAPGPVPNPFSFSTDAYKNPYILLTEPYDGEIDVPLDRDLSIRFSKPMNTSSVSWAMVPFIAFSTDWFDNDTLMVLSHTIPFVECTQYTVSVMSGLDKSGNPLVPGPVPNPWTFYTIVLCPYVVLTDPMQNQTNVSVTADIVVVFSRPMNVSSLSWSITPDPVIWSEDWPSDNMLVLSHSNPFQPLATYVLVIDYIEDTWGAPLCPLPFVLTFTTAS